MNIMNFTKIKTSRIVRNGKTILRGDTYPIKEEIKRAGGTWSSADGCWWVPEEKYEELNSMLTTVQPKKVEKKMKVLEGQLWEPCRRCNQEPVYLSLNCLCENCG